MIHHWHHYLATAVYGHLLDDVLRDGGELPGTGHVVAVAQAQPPVGSLPAGEDFPLVGDEKQGLGAAGYGDRVERGENVREDWELDLGTFQTSQLVLVVEAPHEGLDGEFLLLALVLRGLPRVGDDGLLHLLRV